MTCYASQMLLCGKRKCQTCYIRSFEYKMLTLGKTDEEKKEFKKRLECYSKNNLKKPYAIKPFSHTDITFNCYCGHTFIFRLDRVSAKHWCPYCYGTNICDKKECNICYKKTYEYFMINSGETDEEKKLLKERLDSWDKSNIKQPHQVHKCSEIKFKQNCKCGHSILKKPHCITNNGWCAYCNGSIVCCKEECKVCFHKTLESYPDISIYFSSRNTKKLYEIMSGTDSYKIWIICQNKDCNHHYEITPYGFTNGVRCSYCCDTSSKFCNILENCRQCILKSYATHPHADDWHDTLNNGVFPFYVSKSSGIKRYHTCSHCQQIYYVNPHSVSKGYWCPCKSNKTEAKLYEFLKIHFSDIIKQYRTMWARKKCYLPFDFLLLLFNIIIELDGAQHLGKEIKNWQPSFIVMMNDCFKMKKANENGYYVVRICQQDVLNDRNNWQEKLLEGIQIAIKEKRNVYIDNTKNEYFRHIICMDKYNNIESMNKWNDLIKEECKRRMIVMKSPAFMKKIHKFVEIYGDTLYKNYQIYLKNKEKNNIKLSIK